MFQKNEPVSKGTVSLNIVEPYDFRLSLLALRSFQPIVSEQSDRLRLTTRVDGNSALMEVSQSPKPKGSVRASSVPEVSEKQIRRVAEWVLFAELDLAPFYQLVEKQSKLATITKKLYGLKPTRPESLFEMAVIAITEQQISLSAAYHIRRRLVERFGEPIQDLWVFPAPETLAMAAAEELHSCGLSKQKIGYIQGLARKIMAGELDLERLKRMGDDEARETIMGWRGFGAWSADYILVRGLARPDCVPIDDIGVRDVVGRYLGEGRRATSKEVAGKLEAFRPYRGLLAFYLLAEHRLNLTATA